MKRWHFILGFSAVIGSIVTAGLSLRHPPDVIVGEWEPARRETNRLFVQRDRTYRVVDSSGQLIENGTWSPLSEPIYRRRQLFHYYDMNGDYRGMYITHFHTKTELDRNPSLREPPERNAIFPYPKGRAYQFSTRTDPALLIGDGREIYVKELRWYREHPAPKTWWQLTWERVESWFQDR